MDRFTSNNFHDASEGFCGTEETIQLPSNIFASVTPIGNVRVSERLTLPLSEDAFTNNKMEVFVALPAEKRILDVEFKMLTFGVCKLYNIAIVMFADSELAKPNASVRFDVAVTCNVKLPTNMAGASNESDDELDETPFNNDKSSTELNV